MKYLLSVVIGLFFTACSASIHPIPSHDRPHQALIIIDMQRGVLDPQGPASVGKTRADPLIQAVQKAILKAQIQQIPIAFIKNEWPSWRWIENLWFHGAFKKDSDWAQVDSRLFLGNLLTERTEFSKDFPSSFSDTRLQPWLEAHQIGTLVIAGLFANKCVLATTRDAIRNGYKVEFISNGLLTQKEEDLSQAIKSLTDLGASVSIHF